MIRIPDTIAILLQTLVNLLQQILDKLGRIELAAYEIIRLLMESSPQRKETVPTAPIALAPGDGLLNHAEAAVFLVKSQKQLTRYRKEGRLAFTRDAKGHYYYRQVDLEPLFIELHGYPKGGFRK